MNASAAPAPLLRTELGDVLRDLRRHQGRTLREISSDAQVSLGYLSEVERGQKEASSELLEAICLALGVLFRPGNERGALRGVQRLESASSSKNSNAKGTSDFFSHT